MTRAMMLWLLALLTFGCAAAQQQSAQQRYDTLLGNVADLGAAIKGARATAIEERAGGAGAQAGRARTLAETAEEIEKAAQGQLRAAQRELVQICVDYPDFPNCPEEEASIVVRIAGFNTGGVSIVSRTGDTNGYAVYVQEGQYVVLQVGGVSDSATTFLRAADFSSPVCVEMVRLEATNTVACP